MRGTTRQEAVAWRKSRRSTAQANCVEVATWRKSTRSSGEANCVEAATADGTVAVRDSKNPDGGELSVGSRTWVAFARSVKDGRL